jgi:hypothetical protein
MHDLTDAETGAAAGGEPLWAVPELVSLPLPPPPPLSPMPGPNAAPSPYAPYQGGGLL